MEGVLWIDPSIANIILNTISQNSAIVSLDKDKYFREFIIKTIDFTA